VVESRLRCSDVVDVCAHSWTWQVRIHSRLEDSCKVRQQLPGCVAGQKNVHLTR
jgi:hypothetical protein